MIITKNICPPVPSLRFDWVAYEDGREEGPHGFGETEEEAKAELLEALEL